MTPDLHVAEMAELYALGTLDPEERARVDAHVATCAACERALGEAEATVTMLDDLTVARATPPARLGRRIAASAQAGSPARVAGRSRATFTGWYATAASVAFVLGIGGGITADRMATAGKSNGADDRALATLATAHFLHESFRADTPGAPVAKVIYARDGGWLYVIVDAPDCRCRIVAGSGAGQRDLGPPLQHGSTSTLFVEAAGRPSTLRLVRDGTSGTLADTPLKY
jgi:hypothetical protein